MPSRSRISIGPVSRVTVNSQSHASASALFWLVFACGFAGHELAAGPCHIIAVQFPEFGVYDFLVVFIVVVWVLVGVVWCSLLFSGVRCSSSAFTRRSAMAAGPQLFNR